MLESLIFIILIVLAFIFSQLFSIENVALDTIVNFIPVLIPTAHMWFKIPRNYLKFMCFESINVRYQIDIKIEECSINKYYFKAMRDNLLKVDEGNHGKIINENFGEYLYTSLLNVETALIEMKYTISEENLIIKLEDKIKYKLFFRLAENLFKQVQLVFAKNKDVSYENVNVRVKIEFIDKEKTDCKNPFWKKLFKGFKNRIVSFKYVTKNKTSVIISNNCIEFIGNDIDRMGEDVNKELTVFKIRN